MRDPKKGIHAKLRHQCHMFVLLLVRKQMAFVQLMEKFTKVLSNYGRIVYVRNQRFNNDISMNACWMSVKIMGSNYNCLYFLMKWLIM